MQASSKQKIKGVVEELKTALKPYLFFWYEWSLTDSCRLAKEEIYIINIYLQYNFDAKLYEHADFYNRPEVLSHLVAKLKTCHTGFKEWVIFKFLCVLIRAVRLRSGSDFMNYPIEALNLPEELKENLKALKISSIKALPEAYSEDDLSEDAVYTRIVDFHLLNKKYAIDKQPVSLAHTGNSFNWQR